MPKTSAQLEQEISALAYAVRRDMREYVRQPGPNGEMGPQGDQGQQGPKGDTVGIVPELVIRLPFVRRQPVAGTAHLPAQHAIYRLPTH